MFCGDADATGDEPGEPDDADDAELDATTDETIADGNREETP